ncbi:MAG: TetR/AcrR family transcriptional regulator [bacterium]
MGIKERKIREKEILREKMLNAAAELLVKDGFENLSIRKIAKKIEYSPALIYHYFKDKSDLVVQLVNQGFDSFLKQVDKIPGEIKKNPEEHLKEFLSALVKVGIEFPNHYKAIFINYLEEKISGSYFAESGKREEGFILLVQIVEEGMSRGIFKEIHVISTAQVVWSSAHGLILTLVAQQDIPKNKKKMIISSFIDLIVNGLKK